MIIGDLCWLCVSLGVATRGCYDRTHRRLSRSHQLSDLRAHTSVFQLQLLDHRFLGNYCSKRFFTTTRTFNPCLRPLAGCLDFRFQCLFELRLELLVACAVGLDSEHFWAKMRRCICFRALARRCIRFHGLRSERCHFRATKCAL